MFRQTLFGYEGSKKSTLVIKACENDELAGEINKFLDLCTGKKYTRVTVNFKDGSCHRTNVLEASKISIHTPEVVEDAILVLCDEKNETISLLEFIRDNTVNKRRFIR